MTMGSFISVSIILILTISPVIFRSSRFIRYLCLFLILAWIGLILLFCLNLTARNVWLSEIEISEKKIEKYKARNMSVREIHYTSRDDAIKEMQKNIDKYLFPLGILSTCLALIAAVPFELNKAESNKDKVKEKVGTPN